MIAIFKYLKVHVLVLLSSFVFYFPLSVMALTGMTLEQCQKTAKKYAELAQQREEQYKDKNYFWYYLYFDTFAKHQARSNYTHCWNTNNTGWWCEGPFSATCQILRKEEDPSGILAQKKIKGYSLNQRLTLTRKAMDNREGGRVALPPFGPLFEIICKAPKKDFIEKNFAKFECRVMEGK